MTDERIPTHVAPRSDQLNGDDLMTGSIIVRIEGVRAGSDEQPVTCDIGPNYQPWKPCKTMRRLLNCLTGNTDDARRWVGLTVELYRDPNVKFGKDETGGIRLSRCSAVDRKQTFLLTEKRGKKKAWTVGPLPAAQPQQAQTSVPATEPVPAESPLMADWKALSARYQTRKAAMGPIDADDFAKGWKEMMALCSIASQADLTLDAITALGDYVTDFQESAQTHDE